MAQHHEEYHVTVEGDPMYWPEVCSDLGIKPLWIELNTFERQLMCAAKPQPGGVLKLAQRIESYGYKIVRMKDEIQPTRLDISTYASPCLFLDVPNPADVIYYECHIKLDGPFRPAIRMSSRDLYRDDRWYITTRHEKPFEAAFLAHLEAQVRQWVSYPDAYRGSSVIAGIEYEAAVLDTNQALDAHWVAR